MSNPPDRRDPEREITALRERLSRLSQASLSIYRDFDPLIYTDIDPPWESGDFQ